MSFLVNRMVYLPLRDLDEGAQRLAKGDLEKPIPVRSTDEFGQLAASFNSMTRALHKSRVELQDWGQTLEEKVEEATRELHIAQAETVRSEKLASVGLLTAGIAHELNNPLTGVLTFSHLVRKQMPEGSPEAEDLDLVIHETKRCLKFAREKTPEKNFSDLNQLIKETARLIAQPAHVDDIEIILELDEHLPAVWIDEDLITQVIMNILVNAQHAIEGEGSITIRTRVHEEHKVSEHSAVMSEQDGKTVPMVEISVIDTGCGIAEADLQRIFDPFFTTKGVGKGTGLGLSVSHGTVAAHGGEIEVESTIGAGTVFRIYLPIGGTDASNDGSEQ